MLLAASSWAQYLRRRRGRQSSHEDIYPARSLSLPVSSSINSTQQHALLSNNTAKHPALDPRNRFELTPTAHTKPIPLALTSHFDCYTNQPQSCHRACNSQTRRPLLWRTPRTSLSNTHTHSYCPSTWELHSSTHLPTRARTNRTTTHTNHTPPDQHPSSSKSLREHMATHNYSTVP
jgi:hypothetical protein